MGLDKLGRAAAPPAPTLVGSTACSISRDLVSSWSGRKQSWLSPACCSMTLWNISLGSISVGPSFSTNTPPKLIMMIIIIINNIHHVS